MTSNWLAGAAGLLLLVNLAATRHHRPHMAVIAEGQNKVSLGKVFCPLVERARASGMTDAQIIEMALARHVPPWIIQWAQKNCTVAAGPRTSLQEAQT